MYESVGRYEDLLALIARAELPSRAGEILEKSFLRRRLLEPAFQMIGLGINAALRALPADTALSIEQHIYRGIVGKNPTYPLGDSREGVARAAALREAVCKETGASPAIIALLAHPPVDKELLYLNVELFRHSLWGLRRARGAPCRSRLVNAMDAFALDMLPLYEEGIYAGMMSSYHLGFDRMPGLRGGLGSALLGHAHWSAMAGRVRRTLGRGGEMIMVLGGGVHSTARLFYALRERVGSWCRRSPRRLDSGLVMRSAADGLLQWFSRLTVEGAIGPTLAKSRWRAIEMCLIYSAVADGRFETAAVGHLPAETREAFTALGAALGYGEREIDAQTRALEAEFARTTPYRERFFRFLANAVVRSGRPAILMPLTLGDPKRVEIRWGDPVAVEAVSGPVRSPRIRVRDREGLTDRLVDDFAREFVEAEFR